MKSNRLNKDVAQNVVISWRNYRLEHSSSEDRAQTSHD